ncbi:hypothetical protein HYQ45_010768 [Verticillium longisporum]|uniref:Uncharacterized protein n=1 Tax=Verticillium longisporum TaxID=100787 RepID=A0A8I2ZFZ4_VERLO|nr:hypothetical protein HYQ45_010768 [Verticillium longisporum]
MSEPSQLDIAAHDFIVVISWNSTSVKLSYSRPTLDPPATPPSVFFLSPSGCHEGGQEARINPRGRARTRLLPAVQYRRGLSLPAFPCLFFAFASFLKSKHSIHSATVIPFLLRPSQASQQGCVGDGRGLTEDRCLDALS